MSIFYRPASQFAVSHGNLVISYQSNLCVSWSHRVTTSYTLESLFMLTDSFHHVQKKTIGKTTSKWSSAPSISAVNFDRFLYQFNYLKLDNLRCFRNQNLSINKGSCTHQRKMFTLHHVTHVSKIDSLNSKLVAISAAVLGNWKIMFSLQDHNDIKLEDHFLCHNKKMKQDETDYSKRFSLSPP